MFNLVFISIWRFLKGRGVEFIDSLANKPALVFLILFLVSWIAYVPVAYNIGAATWTGWGPFDFQLSRILFYFVYFLIGVLLGNTDFINKVFEKTALLVANWRLWLLSAILVFVLLTMVIESGVLVKWVTAGYLTPFFGWMSYYTLFIASCTLSCIAFTTFFAARIKQTYPWWSSLADNAYLIYLLHYVFITWIQFALRNVDMHAIVKFLITFSCALMLSWYFAIQLRKVKLFRKYL